MSGTPLHILILATLVVVTTVSAVGFTKLFKRYPKSYIWANIPIMIYPYVYMIVLYIAGKTSTIARSFGMDINHDISNTTLEISFILVIIYHPLICGTLIADFVSAIKGYLTPKSMAVSSLIVKSVQVPAYIFHYLLGIVGVVTNVITGFAPLWLALFIDFVTISLTGAFTTANSVGLCRCRIISKPIAVLASLLSFVFCIDLADVIGLYILSRRKIKKLG